MSLTDFFLVTPFEFKVIVDSFNNYNSDKQKERWEQTRYLATCILQPYSKDRINPKRLLPFPWDDEAKTDNKCNSIKDILKEWDSVKADKIERL